MKRMHVDDLVQKIMLCFLAFCCICNCIGYQVKAEEVDDAENQEKVELVELREENMKFYELPDGSRQCVIYADNIHYKNENGLYEEIDNQIIADTQRIGENEYLYRNKVQFTRDYTG